MSLKFYLPAFFWALLIFVIIAVPGTYVPKAQGIWELLSWDKAIHIILFAPLSFLLASGIYRNYKQKRNAFWIAFAFGIVYAISTELLQYYIISGRNGNRYDAIADMVGVLLGLLLFLKKPKIVTPN